MIDVMKEFIYGLRSLHFVGPCVTVFGSARFPETHPFYEMARKMGSEIVKLGFTVMTGGGPGIMLPCTHKFTGTYIILLDYECTNKFISTKFY